MQEPLPSDGERAFASKLDAALMHRAAPPGSMRYYAWLYTPQQHRDVIAALFLIEAELHDSARAAHEVAHIRLQWWREEIDRLIAGQAQHPAMRVLQASARSHSDYRPLHGAVLSAAQELARATYDTDAELAKYLCDGLGSLTALAARQFADTPTATLLDAATQLGAFIRQVEITRDLRTEFNHGRLYLPLTILDEMDIEYETLGAEQWPDSLVQLLAARSKQELAAYRALKQGLLSKEQEILRPLLVLGDLHARLLQSIASDPAVQIRRRLELSPIRKLWTAWVSARGA